METPTGQQEMVDFRKKVKKMDTKKLEVMHKNTIEKYEKWAKEQDELAKMYEEWTVEPKENEMAKASAPKVEEKVEVVETVERKALKALFLTVLTEEDRPDISAFTDDQVAMELKENIELLAPEDAKTVKAMDDGEMIWEYFVSVRAELTGVKPAAAKKEKAEKKPAEDVVKKIPGSTRIMQLTCIDFFENDGAVTPADVKAKLAAERGKLSDSLADAWIADTLKILRYLKSTDHLK